MKDVERSLYEHLLQVTFVWPGITHDNVWSMPYDIWCLYVEHVETILRLRAGAPAVT